MKLRPFAHPDICPTVIRRRVADELLTLLFDTRTLTFPWDTGLWQSYFPNTRAYRSAISRLRKDGLVAYRRTGGKTPVLVMTAQGAARAQDVCRHSKPWPKQWAGTWYVISYDIPETHRSYREALRAFLKEKRMGCLHKSTWITPHDIRPEYDDLVTAGAVSDFSFLLEARTVLGRSPAELVGAAWDMDTLRSQQHWYIEVFEENLQRAASGAVDTPTLHTLIRDEQAAYTTVMMRDPLLPRPLWPSGYLGESAWTFHRNFVREMARILRHKRP